MKKLISLLLALCLTLTLLTGSALAAGADDSAALTLHRLGLLRGSGVNADGSVDFELSRAPTRLEALVMLIRLLGQEEDALACTEGCPFTDVPDWGRPYAAYAFDRGLTNGVAPNQFGMGEATTAMYLTFTLRALGYDDDPDDGSPPDFHWDDCSGFCRELGLLTDGVDYDSFHRGGMALISYAALGCGMKNGGGTLADKLISAGVFSRELFDAEYVPSLTSAGGGSGRQAPVLLPDGPREFSFTVANIAEDSLVTAMYLSDGSVTGSDWQHTDEGWVEFTIAQDYMKATYTVYSDVDFEHIDGLKIRYVKGGGVCTAFFGCPIENGGRYWLDEESNMSGGSLMSPH